MWVWESHAGQGSALILAALLLSATAQPVDILETPEEALHGSGAIKPAPVKAEGLRQRIKLFIGIPSPHENGDIRDAARETWIPIAKASHAVAIRFFCYIDTDDKGLMGWMKNEQVVYRDTIIVTPENLGGRGALTAESWQTRMTLNLLSTATEHFEPEYIMRAADNAYTNIPVIMRLLREQRGRGNIWYGHATPGVILDSYSASDKAEYQELWEDSVEPPVIPQYMHGAGAIMSANVGEALLAAQRLVGLRMLKNAEAAIGLWLSAFQMRYINETEAGCSVQAFQPALGGGDDAEWTAAEGRVFCLGHEMPLAVVHPLTPGLMRMVLTSAAACRDTLSNRNKD